MILILIWNFMIFRFTLSKNLLHGEHLDGNRAQMNILLKNIFLNKTD